MPSLRLTATLALPLTVALATVAPAQELAYDCGLGMSVFLDPGAGLARFSGPYETELAANGEGAWVNDARGLQFWPEDAPPSLFVGSEQFSCEMVAGDAAAVESPGMDAGARQGPASLADLSPAFYATTRGWEVQSLADASGFVGCAAGIEQPAGFLILAATPWGWTLRIPADATEGFEGGVITVDGRVVDAQFGFTAEGAAEAGLSVEQVAALRDGSAMTTQIAGAAPNAWSLAGSAAMLGKVEECMARQGVVP